MHPFGKAALGAALFTAALLAAPAVSAQSGGDFTIARSTIDGGGSTERSPDDLLVRGTIGQPDVGHIGFGSIVLTGGFWATGERTGIFFRDGFESGDTSAWSSTVGAALLGGDPPGAFAPDASTFTPPAAGEPDAPPARESDPAGDAR